MRTVYPPESRRFLDHRTGREIRQVTTATALHHHPFFLVPAYDADGRWLFFISHRTGRPQLFAEERSSGRLVQLTDLVGLNEWSIHPSPDGRWVYLTTQAAAYRVELSTSRLEQLLDFHGSSARGQGMVAGGMGTTALSPDGATWAIKLEQRNGTRLVTIDTSTATARTLTEHDAIAHMQFCPDDPDLLFFAGNFKERLWTIRVDGGTRKTQHYPPQQRPAGSWVTHESWLPGHRELAFVDWPHAVRAVNIDNGAVRDLARLNAWHAIADPTGQWMVCDTNAPDRGIHIFPTHAVGVPPALVCLSEASNAGDHWHGPFPYNNGPITVVAPQHTHPHPRFAPDNRFIVFTSDRSGTSQVYEAAVTLTEQGLDRPGGATA